MLLGSLVWWSDRGVWRGVRTPFGARVLSVHWRLTYPLQPSPNSPREFLFFFFFRLTPRSTNYCALRKYLTTTPTKPNEKNFDCRTGVFNVKRLYMSARYNIRMRAGRSIQKCMQLIYKIYQINDVSSTSCSWSIDCSFAHSFLNREPSLNGELNQRRFFGFLIEESKETRQIECRW